MGEGLIRINAVGVYRSGNIAFDIAYDEVGDYPVQSINWGVLSDWNPDTWKSATSGGNFYRSSGANALIGDNVAKRGNCLVASGSYADPTIEAAITVLSGKEGQVLVGYKNEGNFVFAGLGDDGYTGAITKVAASTHAVLAHTATSGTKSGIVLGQKYKIKLETMGDYLFLYKDDLMILWAKNPASTTGKIGLTNNGSKIQVDSYKATDTSGRILFQDNFGDYTKETDFYIVNKEPSPLTCTASAENILPVGLAANMNISWDLENPIRGISAERVKLKMDVLPNAPAGDFSYDLTITGKTP